MDIYDPLEVFDAMDVSKNVVRFVFYILWLKRQPNHSKSICVSEIFFSISGETAFLNFREKAHMSRKSQGSHKVKYKTIFYLRIYVDISQSVTACSSGTRLVSSFSDPWYWTSNPWYYVLFVFVFAHEVLVSSVPCSWHNNLSNSRLTVPCCFFTAAGESFLVVFIPSSVTGFHSLRILCTPLFLPG